MYKKLLILIEFVISQIGIGAVRLVATRWQMQQQNVNYFDSISMSFCNFLFDCSIICYPIAIGCN